MYCTAELTYLGGTVEVAVEDGREATTDFEAQGFVRLDHESQVRDWRAEDQVDDVHGAEIEKLARTFVGCDAVAVYPALFRTPAAAAEMPDYAPITFVHSDYTDAFGSMIVDDNHPYRAFLDPVLDRYGIGRDELKGAGRTMMLQFWRNTGPALADYPLGFCDARDIGPDRQLRFIVPNYGGQHLEFETFGFAPPEDGRSDRWYTFPQLRPDEVVAFRTYDSECVADARPYWTPHSAFRDPHAPDGPEHRRASVEMRALCLWR
jgi:hypothetical protein